ncbi:unconventional myosin-XVIIIa-like [Actinia tenebrosa]|uniref:Unconventional myosin-XVIIIa-like n=1 Tax=Actinia tenebrosa TaxID=6105 RepID=A0A6P8H9N8_ACTTE|nr:unconventional myosin-XVIIIa-like [Actinia tenebrosa]
MLSFRFPSIKRKKKEKDKTETKEEKRERRKREKAEKEIRKQEKKAHVNAQQPDPAIADIVAGNAIVEDEKKGTRFSFRKRKYDVEHEYDDTKSPDSNETVEIRQSYHSTGSEGSGSPSQRYGSPRGSINKGAYNDQDYDDYYQNGVHNNESNRGQGSGGPVPASRKRKTSSVEIQLKGDSSNGSDSDRDRATERSTAYKMEKNEERKASKSHGFPPGGRTIALSGTPKGDKQNSDSSAPPKPPRVVKADESGMVELRLVNAGKDRPAIHMSNKPREVVTTSTITNTYSAPFEDFMDASMEEKPIQAGNVQRLESGVAIDVTSPSEKSFDDLGVEFSLPEVVPASPGVPRVIKIQRRLSGDFGFALRRGTSSGSDKTVHFVEPVGPNTAAGILPGDRLIEVNGVNVEDVDREKIIEMIAKSGNEVVIKVVPVSELSELSVRSGLDGSTVQLDESNLKAGTLQRSGSKRMKKKPKSAEEAASQKAWQDAEKVWVVHKAGFSGGRVQRIKPAAGEEEEDTPMCKVKLDHGGEVITIEEESIEKANPPQYDRAEDLASLRYLNESSCLHTLRQRYGSNLIHTYAGPNLIVINPRQHLAIYTDKVIQMFRGCKQEDMPPHIFAAAQTAYRNMMASRVDQSIVLMGSTGSGKTTCAKHILHYLSVTAASQHSPVTDQKFEGIFALLEAFGNASTHLNNNASRFTLLASLDFDSAGMLTCGALQTFLLEKYRVVRQNDGEGSFHVFYYLLAGSDPKLRKELQLDKALKEMNDFISGFDPQAAETHKLSEKWTEIEFALNMLGITSDESKAIWSTLAAIYHLGGAGITMGSDNKPYFSNPAAVQRAASAIGTTQEELSEIIFAPPPVNQFTIRMRNKTDSPTPPSSAEATPERHAKGVAASYIEALEGFAIGLYQEAFNALVRLINRSLQCGIRSVSTMHILDAPGFQNPPTAVKENGASFEDLCHNYESERFQKFFHHTVFNAQMERYSQENIECSFESVATSPEPVVNVFDKAVKGLTRGSTLDLKNEQKGLLWILDEESIFPGANDSSFLARVYVHHCSDKQSWVKQGPRKDTFYVNHSQGTVPVLYNARGWLKLAREHSTTKQARGVLSDSSKPPIADLFSTSNTGESSISRSRSFKRTSMTPPTAIKKNSQCLQLIYQVDTILEAIRKTKVNFVRTILPLIADGLQQEGADKDKEVASLEVPLVRQQLRAAEMLDAIRIHRQGFPEHMPFAEFRRRFDILAPAEHRNAGPFLDEKKGVEALIEHLDLDKRSYRLGLSQIFFRAGSLAQLEDARDEKNTGTIVELQAHCRGFLARKKFKKLQVQNRAMICIQRNLRLFAAVRSWPWWRLYTKVLPLLNVHRTEEQLQSKTGEVEMLKAKIVKLENENREYAVINEKLEKKVSELSNALAEDRATANHASQVLEEESMERMRLERSLQELQESYEEIEKKNKKLETNLLEAQAIASSATRPIVKLERLERYEGEGASNDEDDEEEDTFYRDRYIQASRQHEELRRKIQGESEQEIEDLTNQKRHLERKLTDEKAENDELQRVVTGLKKKSSRINAEMQDLKLLLEDEQTRNSELEKKQRKFDLEANRLKEEVSHERSLRDKINREKEKYQSEKYRLEQELESAKDDVERLTKENHRLTNDLNDVAGNLGTKGDADTITLKKTIRELEQKIQDQEEELDEQAGEIQVLEQTKLRLEMAAERDKQLVHKELEAKEEELEEIRFSMQKKIKQMEGQLEDEYQEKTASVKAKRELERRLQELRDNLERGNVENEKRLKRELKRTKALLRDAQTVIEEQEKKLKDRNQMKALKDKLEDAEYAAHAARKAKKKVEEELKDVQSQLDSVSKSKLEIENRYFVQLKELTSLQSRVEEDEEDMETLTEKNRQLIKQVSETQTQLRDTENLLHDTITEKEALELKISTMSSRLDYLEGSTVDKQTLSTMDSKMKELESKLDFEGTFKKRQDTQVNRLKEQVLRLQEERDECLLRETKLQQENMKLERHMREMKDETSAIEKRDGELKKKKSEAEREVESLEIQLASTKQELALSKKRVAELQHALEDDMHSDSDRLSDGDLSDDSDLNLETSSRVPSEPRSYRSIEDLDERDELDSKLKKKLREFKDSSIDSHSGTSSPADSSTRKTSANLSPRSEKGEDRTKHTDESSKRKKSAEHKSRDDRRKKSIEKRKSLERMSRKAKEDIPGAFDL